MKLLAQFYLFILVFGLTACQTGTVQSRLLTQFEDHEEECTSKVVKSPKYIQYLALHAANRQLFLIDNLKRQRAFAVLTGDSISALFLDPMRDQFLPGLDVVNRGIGGDMTELLLYRIDQDVLMLRPRYVIISISGNDIIRNRCSSFALNNVELILKQIQKKSPRTRVLITSIPPVYEKRLNGIIVHYNQRLRNLVAMHRQASYIDLHSMLVNAEGNRLDEKYWIETHSGKIDRVHFNEAGYKVWAKLLLPILKSR